MSTIAVFIARNLCPYSVVENQGFHIILHTLETKYDKAWPSLMDSYLVTKRSPVSFGLQMRAPVSLIWVRCYSFL